MKECDDAYTKEELIAVSDFTADHFFSGGEK